MKKVIYLLVLMLVLLNLTAVAQKKKTVRAKGSAISHDLTPEQTKANAIEDAKRNALVKAGISESISFTDFSYKFEDNEKFGEIFQVISSIETGGEIIVNKILSESIDINEFDNMVVEVEIEATVYRHKKKADPTFMFTVDGIDEVYQQGDLMQFKVRSTQDSYLKVFNITEDEISLLYPFLDPEYPKYHDVADRLFTANETVQLPENPAFIDGYDLELENPDKSQEFTILFFVFTKRNIPFIQEATINNVMKWVYAIPPDERITAQEGFVIKKGK